MTQEKVENPVERYDDDTGGTSRMSTHQLNPTNVKRHDKGTRGEDNVTPTNEKTEFD
jgi:hypothetical protein